MKSYDFHIFPLREICFLCSLMLFANFIGSVIFHFWYWIWFFSRFYPFHYSPYVSDLVNIESFDMKLDIGTPFRPFEQLLAVLPAYSRQLLPKAFQVNAIFLFSFHVQSSQCYVKSESFKFILVILIAFLAVKIQS